MNALTLKKFGAVAASTAVLALGVITPALAQVGGTTDEQGSLGLGTIQTEAGFGQKNLYATVGSLIRVALSLLGVVAIVIILLGGFKWMTAAGNEEKVGDAKKLLIAGVIGMLIILSAFAITTFVLGSLQKATGAGFTVPGA